MEEEMDKGRMAEELEMGAAPANWPSPRDLDDLMADREVANLQSLLKANGQASMQQWLQVDPSQGLTKDVEKRPPATRGPLAPLPVDRLFCCAGGACTLRSHFI